MARDEWYEDDLSGWRQEEELHSKQREAPPPGLADHLESRVQEHADRVLADWHEPGPHCPNCLALLREIDWACLTCGALLTAPIRAHSEAEARRRGWIE